MRFAQRSSGAHCSGCGRALCRRCRAIEPGPLFCPSRNRISLEEDWALDQLVEQGKYSEAVQLIIKQCEFRDPWTGEAKLPKDARFLKQDVICRHCAEAMTVYWLKYSRGLIVPYDVQISISTVCNVCGYAICRSCRPNFDCPVTEEEIRRERELTEAELRVEVLEQGLENGIFKDQKKVVSELSRARSDLQKKRRANVSHD